MLALSMLPLACFADRPVTARMTVGVFQDFAPSPHHMQHVLLPLLERMGVAMELQVIRAGYVPRGRGTIELFVRPAKHSLHTLTLKQSLCLGLSCPKNSRPLFLHRSGDRTMPGVTARIWDRLSQGAAI